MSLPSRKGDLLDWAGHPSSQASVFFFSRKRFVMYIYMETNSNLNKMCYISLIEKLITSFRLKKLRFWEGYSAMNLSLEIATALQVHK